VRILTIGLVLLVAACTPEQSKNIGNQPKKTIDSVSSKTGAAIVKDVVGAALGDLSDEHAAGTTAISATIRAARSRGFTAAIIVQPRLPGESMKDVVRLGGVAPRKLDRGPECKLRLSQTSLSPIL